MPAETQVLAETATSENSSRISSCNSREMRLKRIISREMASTSLGGNFLRMAAALSWPSMTSSAASFCVLLSAPFSAAGASRPGWAADMVLLFCGPATLVHPIADGLGHVGRIFFDEFVEHLHGHDARLRFIRAVARALAVVFI